MLVAGLVNLVPVEVRHPLPDYLRIYELEVENEVRSKLTVNEILAFQRAYGLHPDGHLGPVTAYRLAQHPEWEPPDEPWLSDAPEPARDGMLSCKCDRPTKTLDIKTYNAFRPINRVCAECGRQARYTRQHPPPGGDTWRG